jgi:hypothetical protein
MPHETRGRPEDDPEQQQKTYPCLYRVYDGEPKAGGAESLRKPH